MEDRTRRSDLPSPNLLDFDALGIYSARLYHKVLGR